jgi:hypothetical protein
MCKAVNCSFWLSRKEESPTKTSLLYKSEFTMGADRLASDRSLFEGSGESHFTLRDWLSCHWYLTSNLRFLPLRYEDIASTSDSSVYQRLLMRSCRLVNPPWTNLGEYSRVRNSLHVRSLTQHESEGVLNAPSISFARASFFLSFDETDVVLAGRWGLSCEARPTRGFTLLACVLFLLF